MRSFANVDTYQHSRPKIGVEGFRERMSHRTCSFTNESPNIVEISSHEKVSGGLWLIDPR